MDYAKLFKAMDGIVTLVDSIKGTKEPAARPSQQPEAPTVGLAEQLQAGLTNVVVAALKEAFDRDRARLEMEQAQLEEQRIRAEAALRLEMRRQAVDREAGRLRILGGTALIGWLVDVALLLSRGGSMTTASRIVVATGSLLLLAALRFVFLAYSRISNSTEAEPQTPQSNLDVALWLVLGGLALTIASLLA
jgi:hypothetical protein